MEQTNQQTHTHVPVPEESKVMSIAASRASDYAPMNLNPLRLADVTIKAVDQLGVVIADEIEKTAGDIMRGANEIASKLHEWANVIRQRTEIANQQVESFCARATSMFGAVVELREQLGLNDHESEVDEAEDQLLPMPEFLRKGPAESSDREL
jgi:hypothetical protein